MCILQKHKLINSNKNKKQKTNEKGKQKKKYVHSIQGLLSSKVSFQGLDIHRIGVKLPF
jgi:hypothetical protein